MSDVGNEGQADSDRGVVAMQLSVVITTRNRWELLSRTLPTVIQQSCSPDAFEIIVVIDGSTDGTAEKLKQFRPAGRFRIIEQINRGRAAARNLGLKAACAELILLLDDDLLCGPDLIAEHVTAHRRAENLVVCEWRHPASPP